MKDVVVQNKMSQIPSTGEPNPHSTSDKTIWIATVSCNESLKGRRIPLPDRSVGMDFLLIYLFSSCLGQYFLTVNPFKRTP
jgi:hypothetical protein